MDTNSNDGDGGGMEYFGDFGAVLNDVDLEGAVAAQLNRFARAGQIGGRTKGATKARTGTGKQMSKYWDAVYAGKIKHPRFDPDNPKRKKCRSYRYSDEWRKLPKDEAEERKEAFRKARTDRPTQGAQPTPVPVPADPVTDAEFNDLMAGMGLGF